MPCTVAPRFMAVAVHFTVTWYDNSDAMLKVSGDRSATCLVGFLPHDKSESKRGLMSSESSNSSIVGGHTR